MSHTEQNESHLAKWVTLKNGSHLEIWLTIGKMGQIWENESHFINMGHTFQNCRTWKCELHWAKWVTLGKMGHI